MSPDDKVFKFLDALLPRAECVRFVERRFPCVVDIIGMPSLRGPRLRIDGVHKMIGVVASPLTNFQDPSLLGCLYESLRDDVLASDPDAINDLGWLWMNGSRLSVDYVLARRLLRLAYVLGSGEAAFNLAEQAWHGRGIAINHDLAACYYEHAYDRGISWAGKALGRLYETGAKGQAPNFEQAAYWYRKAVESALFRG